jgi:hypothetical protein
VWVTVGLPAVVKLEKGGGLLGFVGVSRSASGGEGGKGDERTATPVDRAEEMRKNNNNNIFVFAQTHGRTTGALGGTAAAAAFAAVERLRSSRPNAAAPIARGTTFESMARDEM